MKIKNGGANFSVIGKFEREFDNNSLYIVCVLDGSISCNGEKLALGNSIFLNENERIVFEAETPSDYAWFELDGVDASEYSSLADFCSPYPDKLKTFVELVCRDGVWQNIDSSYSEGAALILFSLAGIEKQAFVSVGNQHVDMAKRYIDTNYGKQIKIEDIAEELGVDRKYLRNLFFKYLGISTKDYLTNVRIEKAKELLSQNSMAVGEISLCVGYADALAFSKIFKKHVGVSPSEYRNGTTQDEAETTVAETPKTPREDIKYFLL